MDGFVGSLFCGVVNDVRCSLAEEERAGCFTLILLWLSVISASVSCAGLQSVTVAFPGHAHLPFPIGSRYPTVIIENVGSSHDTSCWCSQSRLKLLRLL